MNNKKIEQLCDEGIASDQIVKPKTFGHAISYGLNTPVKSSDGPHAERYRQIKELLTNGAGETVFLCAKCGYGSQEHGMENHPAYLCVADMREVPARFLERAAHAPKEGWVSVTLRPWEESSFGEQIVTLNDPESPNLAPGVYLMCLVPTAPTTPKEPKNE